MNKIRPHRMPLLCLLLTPMLVQCIATSQDVRTLDLRLRTLNNKLTSTERNVNDLQQETTNRANKTTVEVLQKNQAESANSLDYLKTQLLQIKGQVEENTHHVNKLQEDETYYRDSLSTRFHDLSEGIENLRITLDDLQKELAELEMRNSTDSAALKRISDELDAIRTARAGEAAEKARREAEKAAREAKAAEEARAAKAAEAARIAKEAAEAKARAASATGPMVIEATQSKKMVGGNGAAAPEKQDKASRPADPAKTAAADPAQKIYDDGMAAFAAKKFQEAYAAFNSYIEKYPKGDLAANARFWLGDSLYNQQEYELAILEYQKVIADHPKHPKSPAALLKQGLAFEKLKDMETAKLVYYKLEADYPKSEEAATAQKRLASIK